MMNQASSSPVVAAARTATRFGLNKKFPVIPAQAEIQEPGTAVIKPLDFRLRGNDKVLWE